MMFVIPATACAILFTIASQAAPRALADARETCTVQDWIWFVAAVACAVLAGAGVLVAMVEVVG